MRLILVVTLAIVIACAAQAKIMSGAFAVCAEADLGQVVDTVKGTTLEGAVAAIIEGNLATLETALGALAAVVGIDAIDCAIAAVEAAFPPSSSAGSGAGTGSGSGSAVLTSQTPTVPSVSLARDVGFARAHQFVKDWRAGKRPAAAAK